jgi:uncharacterized oligopeptide transporter (OPT) family protein
MTIQHLSNEQLKSMTLKEKDEWWLKNIYRGNMPQLTMRSALTGMVLGSILSLTNLYVGIKTGWTLGVGITSVILSYAFFKFISKLNMGSEMSILENNAMQSIATSAGYMTGPLVSSIPAFMLVTNQMLNPWHVTLWMICLSILGVFYAFPLKKRFINDEQLPFPEGYAAAVVMDGLHTGEGKDGIFKAKILMVGASLSAFIETFRNEALMNAIKTPFLKLPEFWDDIVYKWFSPNILGTPLNKLTVQFDSSIVMVGAGGLMGIKTGASLMLGAALNYLVLAPYLISKGIISGPGFKNITMWALWGGVAMMTTSSLYSFLSKPKEILKAFKFKKDKNEEDILKDIEVPSWVFFTGIGIFGPIAVWVGHAFFGMEWWLGLLALPMVFVFTLIAVNATGLTSITPTSALGKLTQLTYAGIAPGNIPTNIMAAAINGEVASNASNLLMDIKPGYMLGAKPRQQAMGHVLGIFAGSLLSVPVFFMLIQNDLTMIGSDKLPLPSVQVWKSVAEVLTKGLSFLHPSAQFAVLIGAVCGILFEHLNVKMKGKFPLSPVGLGLAFVLRFSDSLSMGLGSFIFWYIGKKAKDPSTNLHKIFVENQETLCAGVIAGGSLIGIVLTVLETFVLH